MPCKPEGVYAERYMHQTFIWLVVHLATASSGSSSQTGFMVCAAAWEAKQKGLSRFQHEPLG